MAQRLVKPRFGVLELLFYWNDVTVIKSLEDTWTLPSLFWLEVGITSLRGSAYGGRRCEEGEI